MMRKKSWRSGRIRYEFAPDIMERALDLINTLDLRHVKLDSVTCIRSWGSSSRRTIARCHGLSKVMQMSLGRVDGFYVLEFISERFDKMSHDEQTKVILHEIMHIPKSFGGGFKHHDFVSERNVERFFRLYKNLKAKGL